MAQFTTPRSFALKGDGIFNQLIAGAYAGQFIIPNITQLDYQPQATSNSIIGTGLDDDGVSLDVINQGGDLLVTIGFNRYTAASLAIAGMGTNSEITAGTGSVSSEIVQLWAGVGHLSRMNVSSVVVLGYDLTLDTDEADGFTDGEVLYNQTTGAEIGVVHSTPDGTSVYVLLTGTAPAVGNVVTDATGDDTGTIQSAGVVVKNDIVAETTDYTITAVNGRITVVSAAGLDITLLTKIKVAYSYTKLAGSQIQVNTNTILKGEFIYKGINKVDSNYMHIRIPQLNLTPSAANVLRGDDRSATTFQGVAEKLSTETSAIYIEVAE